jgi:hypothetical protein
MSLQYSREQDRILRGRDLAKAVRAGAFGDAKGVIHNSRPGTIGQNPVSAEGAIHSSSFLHQASASACIRVMKQAVGLQQNNDGTMNPGLCPGLV